MLNIEPCKNEIEPEDLEKYARSFLKKNEVFYVGFPF